MKRISLFLLAFVLSVFFLGGCMTPAPPAPTEISYYDSGTLHSAVILDNGDNGYLVHFAADDLSPYAGRKIVGIRFDVFNGSHDLTLLIYSGADIGSLAAVQDTQVVTGVGVGIHDLMLDTPIDIAGGTDYWAGVKGTQENSSYIAIDDGTDDHGVSYTQHDGGGWTQFTDGDIGIGLLVE